MKLKILYLILFILIFMPIGLCKGIEDIELINNTKIYDKNDEIISIYDKNNDKSMNIKLISTTSDINKLIKIVEVTNFKSYIPNKKNDFITKTKKIYGKNNIYKIEYFIEKYNYTFKNIIINETIFNNKTGKNENKLINKTIIKDIKPFWVEFKPYDRIMFKNETFKLKIIHYKKSELGFFKIQTIPIFKNIECKEFTWWSGNWNLKRPILINNINGDNVTNYQLKSVNLSQYQINASSARIINESSGLILNHWNETINFNGNLEYVWCNFSKINNGSWINETYYIYYQSNPNVNTISSINKTFVFGDDFKDNIIDNEIWISIIGNQTEIDETLIITRTETDSDIRTVLSFMPGHAYKAKLKINGESSNIQQFGFSNRITNINWHSCDDGAWFYTSTAPYLNSYTNNEGITTINGNTRPDNGVYHIYDITWLIEQVKFYDNGNLLQTHITNIPNEPCYSGGKSRSFDNSILVYDWIIIRNFTLNEPNFWTVGNIEYPEDVDMNCSLKIITHLTNKNIKVVDMNGSIIKENLTNECINLSYDSYIIYMSNPVKIDSITGLLNILDNILVQFLLFIFLIIIATLFYVFIQIVKKKGFKGVSK